ncbi:hypothetical protein HZA98_04420 [Candidatus Woesearchaeota archaeon]|nr:hypothetical protein [Candidatus Woesearchaeota archaeon]
MYEKKRFFREPIKTEIQEFHAVEVEKDLVETILSIAESDYILLPKGLVPEKYPSSWNFLRHGPFVRAGLRERVTSFVKGARVPVDFRIDSFGALESQAYAGYAYSPLTIVPYVHRDTRERRVSLVECLEGARIDAYVHQVPAAHVGIEEYSRAGAVKKDGAIFHVHVPRRIKGMRRYQFNINHVPVIDNADKWGIAWATMTQGHDCLRGEYLNIRFAKQDTGVFNWCAHEIAGYFAVIRTLNERGNKVPLQMSQFALPTPLTVDFYKRLCDSVLVHDEELESKDKIRKLNKAEKEILLWGLVGKKGHHPTFFAKDKIKDYDWSLRHRE